jgi:RNA polymerase sigma factor (sigma-70 family)
MPEESRELLVRYQNGDPTAADAIFARYTSRLLALARSRLSPKLARRIDADDVVQSTYRSFFVHARVGDLVAGRDGDLWQLLATITLHKLSRQSKRHLAAKRSLQREVTEETDSARSLANLADREPSPADVVAAVEELHWLMTQFEPIQRQALQLRLQELTAEEIAAAVGRSDRTVRRWLVEARELLSARWEQQRTHADYDRPRPTSSFPHSALPDVAAPLEHSDYHLESLIGSGGMAKVYIATQKGTDRRVAIKVLRKRLRSRLHLVERFLREAELVARFDHPNIVRVQGLGRLPDGNYFMVLDFVDGSDLASLLRSESLSVRRAAEIVTTVADAIQHAHEHGVIHRDLKPGNVLLDRNAQVFVTDFGFAWFDSEIDREDHSIVGTAGFMAPEQIDVSLGPTGPHTDVYGLGALLFMLCCGRPPHVGNSVSEILEPVAKPDRQARHCEIDRSMPDALGHICERCLAHEWQHRFSSASDVAFALRAWANST